MKNKNKQNIFLNIIFLIGFLVALYPFYVGALNHFIDQQRINTIQKQTSHTIKQKELDMRKKNEKLSKDGLQPGNDPFSGSNYKEHVILKRHLIGTISIPKINLHIPLFDTTNEETLNYGATVLQGTSFPIGGKGTHSVISGHRGLASRVLFTNLNQVKKNDVFVLQVFDKKLAYKIFKIEVIKPENYQGLKIEQSQDLVTLLTCTPYMINSHRLLLTGKRIPYPKDMSSSIQTSDKWHNIQQALIILFVMLFLVGQVILLYKKFVNWRLAKKTYNLAFYRVDLNDIPLPSVPFQLFSKNKKVPIQRDNPNMIRYADRDGLVLFENLPGGCYYIKELALKNNNGVVAGVKKLKSKEMIFYPTKSTRVNYYFKDAKLWIKR